LPIVCFCDSFYAGLLLFYLRQQTDGVAVHVLIALIAILLICLFTKFLLFITCRAMHVHLPVEDTLQEKVNSFTLNHWILFLASIIATLHVEVMLPTYLATQSKNVRKIMDRGKRLVLALKILDEDE